MSVDTLFTVLRFVVPQNNKSGDLVTGLALLKVITRFSLELSFENGLKVVHTIFLS